ncbi:MAG: efflux RND transporter permease subunit [Bacteroidetes bacterium]|nr:MAG: efflux RND transporter permease subunit [Bacteroidota bacterium]
MTLYTLSIRRPVLATVMSITIVLFGLVGLTFLGVREYPSVDAPIVTVSTTYPGANADVIESQITEPIEASVNGVAGIRMLTSTSAEGQSTVTVEFNLDIEMEAAANDVRDRVARVIGALPPDANPPVVTKADADAQPILFIELASDSRSLLDLSRFAEETVRERLQTISGVSSVQVWGAQTYSMRLWLDQQRLAAYELSPLDIRTALQRENVELPSGRIEGDDVELTIRTLSRLVTPQEFNDLIVKEVDGRIVRLRDVGRAELGPLNPRTNLKRNGKTIIGVSIQPQPGANFIAISDEVYVRIEQIAASAPPDILIKVGFNVASYIEESVQEVQQTILLALLLVMLVIFFFLRDIRTAIIPIVVIPVSLIGSFFVMYIFDYSINVLTLLALVLAIGLVVDDAIVVLENIYAKIEAGLDPVEAGITGTKEIFFAVIATTLALVAVFLPILFLGGVTGRLFQEFGVVLGGAVVISSFVALTLTPMLTTKLLGHGKGHSAFYIKTEPFFERMVNAYSASLETFLNARWIAFPATLGSLALIYFIFLALPKELAPKEDRGMIMMFATAPEGATFEYMARYMDDLERMTAEEIPERDRFFTVTAPNFGSASAVNSAFGFFVLSPASERDRTQTEVANHLTGITQRLTTARAFVSEPESIGNRFGGMPVSYVIQAPTFEELKRVLPEFVQAAQAEGTFTFVDADLKFNKPELRVSIDRDRARTLGVSAIDIAQTLQLTLSGQRVGYFIMDGKQYQVITQLTRENRNETLDLRSIYVRSASGKPVQMDNLVTITEESSPPQRYRFDRYVSATVSAGLLPGKSVGDGIDAMERVAANILDDSFTTALSGASRDFAESSSSLMFIFILALILVYLVLAAQFESFRSPLIVMLTVPLALAGALVSLWYFDQSINIFSQIGMIMLIGMGTKNGILIVEFANQRKAEGLSKMEAIKSASRARFRPVIMTSISTILGIFPIALALGAGAASRVPMGIAIIGGMLIGSVLTLYIIPAMYSYFSKSTPADIT